MIDVSQWRSSIGLWYSSCQPFCCLKSSTVLSQFEKEQLLSSLIEILLILSGNVELNPGPMTDDVRKILQDVLRENFAVLSEAIKHCVPRTAELMYSSRLISGYQVDTNNRQSMIDEFGKGMPFKNDVSELQSHCQLFLDCLSCQGGPPLEVAQHLAKMWTEHVQQELEISLSFDVKHAQPMETTPSSTSSSTDPIMAATSPQMDQLSDWLKPLAEWENFAIYLPKMTIDDVEIIKKDERGTVNQKRALYLKWLEVYPTASWNDVITALERDKNMSLAADVRQKLNEIQSLSNSHDRREDISSGNYKHINLSPQSRDSDTVNDVPIEVTLLPNQEKEIEGSLINLHNKFTTLEGEFKKGLKQFIRNERGTILDIIDYIERYTRNDDAVLRSCTTIDDLMRHINNYYDFLECRVLAETAEKFVSPDLACEFRAHLDEAKQFRSSASVKTLREHLNKIYKPYMHNSENAPKALIDMHTAWDDVAIEGLYKLMRRFYPRNGSLLKNIEITASSVHIEYYMTESQDEIKQIIEYCQQNASITRYIGIFGLEINGVIILDDQHKDEHYTFEYGLLKAAEDGNNEAVQFLVELGIDVNHVTEEGQTPLTLAITNGHEHVVEILISAESNINPQVKWTPLAIAVKEEDTLELTRYLLDHGAHCNVLINGKSILDMTLHEETHQLLYQHGAMTTQELRYFELKDKLEGLMAVVQNYLNDLLSAGSITLTEVKDQVIDYISQDIRCESVEELLVLLQPFCSIFNVNPLKAVIEKFLRNEIISDFDDYSENLNKFEMSTKLHHMVHVMGVVSDIQPISSIVTIKFNSQWRDVLIADVHKLHKYCFVSIHQFLTLTDVNEEDFKIVLTYKVPSSQCSPIISIVSSKQQQFMKQVGICEIIVDGVILLVNDQEMALEQVLHQAIDDNNDILISFLRNINGGKPVAEHSQSLPSQPLIENGSHEIMSNYRTPSGALSPLEGDIDWYTFTSPDEQLMYAASIGDNNTVKSLLDQNIFEVDVNYCDEDGMTPLIMAASNNHLDVIDSLLSAGASKLVNHQNNDGATALMLASDSGNLEVIKCLLAEDGDANVQTSDGWTALMLASQNGHLEVVKCLLTEVVDLDVQTSDGMTALMLASDNGHLEVVKCLLKMAANPDLANEEGITALMLLCSASYEFCKYYQFDDDTIQRQALHCIRMIELLLDANASPIVTHSNSKEMSSLTLAASANNLDAVNVLMRRVEFSNELISHALIAACYVGNPSVINALSRKITNLPHKELLPSCAEGDLAAVVSSIYVSDVNPNTSLLCGLTPLMIASSCGHIELIDALIQAGADINLPNDYGHTPLDIVDHEYGIHFPNQNVISILVEQYGATHKNPVDGDKLFFYSSSS